MCAPFSQTEWKLVGSKPDLRKAVDCGQGEEGLHRLRPASKRQRNGGVRENRKCFSFLKIYSWRTYNQLTS